MRPEIRRDSPLRVSNYGHYINLQNTREITFYFHSVHIIVYKRHCETNLQLLAHLDLKESFRSLTPLLSLSLIFRTCEQEKILEGYFMPLVTMKLGMAKHKFPLRFHVLRFKNPEMLVLLQSDTLQSVD